MIPVQVRVDPTQADGGRGQGLEETELWACASFRVLVIFFSIRNLGMLLVSPPILSCPFT